ncbi:MAG: hypothetical protein USCAAHI_00230 [Beijerinckiaceae bacterium]|nr:MAG: hypothetical protein USCAAHI_00230 [Beijerinckiaceae bacterium]
MSGQGIFADGYGLATLKASMNIDIRRNFVTIAGGFKDHDGRSYVCKIGPRLRELLFVIRD